MPTAPQPAESLPVDAQERVLKIHLGVLIAIVTILGVFAIKSLYAVAMPLVFALFLAILLRPLQAWVSARVPWKLRWLGALAAVIAFFALAGLMAGCIWLSVELVSTKGPAYTEAAGELWNEGVRWMERRHIPVSDAMTGGQAGLPEPLIRSVSDLVRSAWMFIAFTVIVFFLMLLFLLEAHEWARKSLEAFLGPKTERIVATISAVADKLRRYFYVRAGISFISAVVEGTWIWILGIDFAFVWGLLFFVLNFVPNIGSMAAAIPPILLAFVQFGSTRAMMLAAGLLVIEQLIGNFVDPRIQGKALQISPAVVLISIVFWTWAWGIPGAFLAVPITIALMIVFSHTESLQPVAILLSRPGNDEVLKRSN